MNARFLIISPMRNEAAHVERVARAVAAQELPPVEWVVVDDASDDGTGDILARLEREIPFLRVVPGPGTQAPDRLARAAAPRAFNAGLAAARTSDFTHVMKLDGDVELPPEYLRVLADRFAADPGLGMACGDLIEKHGDAWVTIAIPKTHVHGALKCYTAACFASIGGVQERLGWDTIDETYARMRGFRTQRFPDLVGVHERHLASADGTLRGRARHGECAYIAHFSLLWVALRSFKVALKRPRVLSGAAFFYGYVRAAARRELRKRMLHAVMP